MRPVQNHDSEYVQPPKTSMKNRTAQGKTRKQDVWDIPMVYNSPTPAQNERYFVISLLTRADPSKSCPYNKRFTYFYGRAGGGGIEKVTRLTRTNGKKLVTYIQDWAARPISRWALCSRLLRLPSCCTRDQLRRSALTPSGNIRHRIQRMLRGYLSSCS